MMVECCYVNVETPEGELMVYIRSPRRWWWNVAMLMWRLVKESLWCTLEAQGDDGGMLLY